MQNPTTEGLSLSVFESQYDAYLLTERGLSRSTRSLHQHGVHKLLSSRFPIGYISWSEIYFEHGGHEGHGGMISPSKIPTA